MGNGVLMTRAQHNFTKSQTKITLFPFIKKIEVRKKMPFEYKVMHY